MLIDTHAHVIFEELLSQGVENVIARAKEAGVGKIINVGCDTKSSENTVRFASEHDIFYATVGVHPYDAVQASIELMEQWKKLISENKRIVAVGECGLDYLKSEVSKDVQKYAFRLQIGLAKDADVPLIVHCRDAYDDCLAILDEEYGENGFLGRVVFHCYSGTLDFAEKLWERNILTSFTGIVTYPNAKGMQEVAKNVPLDMFMVETDCPYLAPQKYRGKTNEPAFVSEVAKKIAEIKNISYEEVCEKSTENAKRFFKRFDL